MNAKVAYDNTYVDVFEVAGKDSFAALAVYLKEYNEAFPNYQNVIQPIVVNIPHEYAATGGNRPISEYKEMLDIIRKEFPNDRIMSIIVLEDDEMWHKYCTDAKRQMSYAGIYTPCVMCHTFTHIIRDVYMAKKGLSGGKIITGERLKHDGKFKANQTGKALDLMTNPSVVCHEILRPVLNYTDKEIDEVLTYYYGGSSNFGYKCINSGKYALEPSGALDKHYGYVRLSSPNLRKELSDRYE